MNVFDEKDFRKVIQKTLENRPMMEKAAEEIHEKGYSSIFLIGAGGTYCQFEPYEYLLRGISKVPVYCEIAAEFMARPHQAFDEKSLVFVASRSGDTKEIVELLDFIKKTGNTTVGFIYEKHTPIGEKVDYVFDIESKGNHQVEPIHMMTSLFLFKLLALRGEFEDFEEFSKGLDNCADEFLAMKKKFSPVSEAFAKKHKDTDFIMFIGSGSVYGEMYGQAMCIFEEMQWIKAQSVKAAEFFHGALEIVEKDTPVIIVRPEDWSQAQADRAIKFCKDHTDDLLVIDLADYELPSMPKKFRPLIGQLLTDTLSERLGADISVVRDHSLDIRRYYRQFEY